MNHLLLGMPGPGEWVLILAVLLLIFGGRKLPELARAMGRSITEFRTGLKADPEDPPDGSGGSGGSGGAGSKTKPGDKDRS